MFKLPKISRKTKIVAIVSATFLTLVMVVGIALSVFAWSLLHPLAFDFEVGYLGSTDELPEDHFVRALRVVQEEETGITLARAFEWPNRYICVIKTTSAKSQDLLARIEEDLTAEGFVRVSPTSIVWTNGTERIEYSAVEVWGRVTIVLEDIPRTRGVFGVGEGRYIR